jgi:formylglycine-generating enzyme required for sulfatase activity
MCGRGLVDASAILDLPDTLSFKVSTSCCPDPSCSALVAVANTNFCALCGVRLQPISYELWVDKFVKPALAKNPAMVFLEPANLFRPAAEMGLSVAEARKHLDSLLEERTGVARDVLDGWVQEATSLFEADQKLEAVQLETGQRAKELNIDLHFATAVVGALLQRIEASSLDSGRDYGQRKRAPNTNPQKSAPASPAETGSRKLDRPKEGIRVRKLRKRTTAEAPSLASLAGSAKWSYRNLVAGLSVSNDLVYLDAEISSESVSLENGRGYVYEVSSSLGAFVLFPGSDEQGFVFPNPRLNFTPGSFKLLFPNLTVNQFEHSKLLIEPVHVGRVGKGRWQVTPSENTSVGAQANSATIVEDTGSDESKSSNTFPALVVNEVFETLPVPHGAVQIGANRFQRRVLLTLMGLGSFVLIVAFFIGLYLSAPWFHPNAPVGMVRVPGGVFQMGSNSGDEYEKPAHQVTVAPFFLDCTEVTCEEYERFIKATKNKTPASWSNGTYPTGAAKKPVTGVEWNDANAYAQWAKKRLPTEEEWEFAARGSTGWRYPWGDDWKADLANVNNASKGFMDVGSYKASPLGLFDMVGNAWEWTSSSIHSYPGGKIVEDQLTPAQRENIKVIRGGCYLSSERDATTTYRKGWPPVKGKYDYDQTGFRCALDVAK